MRRLSLSLSLVLLVACSSDNNGGGTPGSGGSGGARSGGSTGSGGARTGGSTGSGGSASSGGSTGSGGSASGGSTGSGGSSATGGTSGSGGSSGDAGGDTSGDTSGGDTSTPSGSGNALIIASAGASYGAATPITAIKLNGATGALTKGSSLNGATAAMMGAAIPAKKFAFFVTEQNPAKVVSLSFDPAAATLTNLGEISTGGAAAEFVGIHPSGNWLSVAHYSDGKITIHPIGTDGKAGAASDTESPAPMPTMSQCHNTLWDSTGTYLFATCVHPMAELVAQYKFSNGALTANTPPTVPGPNGVRHLAFSKDEKFVYGVTERMTSVVTYSFDKATGRLAAVGSPVKAFNHPMASIGGSQIVVHPSGKFLYAGSRGDNAIMVFSLDPATGLPTKVSETTDGLSAPRHFELDPSGKHLIAGNTTNDGAAIPANARPGGDVTSFRIDQNTGALTKVSSMPVKLDAMVWSVVVVPQP